MKSYQAILAGAVFLLAGAVYAQQGQTLDERLKIHSINSQTLRGVVPDPADLAILARDKQVSRIIWVLPENKLPQGFRTTAERAGIKLECRSIVPNIDDEWSKLRLDFTAVKDIVQLIQKDTDGITYVCCFKGTNGVGVIEYVYRLLVDKVEYAEAWRQVLDRGFMAYRFPGFVDDMKLFAAGLSELPVVKGREISDQDLLAPGESVKLGSIRLNVKKMGSGPAIYVLHGGPGETHKPFRPYLDALAENHTLVYYDQRGCGFSSKPQIVEEYTLALQVKDLDKLRRYFGHEKISLIGHSSGGILAMEYASKHRECVDKMVIISSWASGKEFSKYENLAGSMMEESGLAVINALHQRAEKEHRRFNDKELSYYLEVGLPQCFFGRVTPEFKADWRRRAQVSALANMGLAGKVFGDYDIRDRLKDLSGLPVLVIAGEFDVIAPVAVVRSIADGIPGSRFEVIPQSGHYSFVEQYDKFTGLVSSFLK